MGPHREDVLFRNETENVQMKTNFLFRAVSLLALASSALTAQIVRDDNVVPLKNWPAPLYWEPTPAEAHAATAALPTVAVATAAAQAQPATGAFVFVGITPCRVVDTRTSQGLTGAFR